MLRKQVSDYANARRQTGIGTQPSLARSCRCRRITHLEVCKEAGSGGLVRRQLRCAALAETRYRHVDAPSQRDQAQQSSATSHRPLHRSAHLRLVVRTVPEAIALRYFDINRHSYESGTERAALGTSALSKLHLDATTCYVLALSRTRACGSTYSLTHDSRTYNELNLVTDRVWPPQKLAWVGSWQIVTCSCTLALAITGSAQASTEEARSVTRKLHRACRLHRSIARNFVALESRRQERSGLHV
jgi:hypothetical protein